MKKVTGKNTVKFQKQGANMTDITNARILMVIGAFGYFLCLIADYMLNYLPYGHLALGDPKSWETLPKVKINKPIEQFAVSGVMGVLSMIFIVLGLVGISEYVKIYAPIASRLILVGGVGSGVLGANYHILCTLNPWFFISFGATEEALEITQKMLVEHSLIFKINPVFYALFAFTLVFVIAAGKTPLPRWAFILNVVLLYMILNKLNVKFGSTSIAGIIMCLGLALLTGIYTQKKSGKKQE